MFLKNWKTEILTIPNLLSVLRLILLPVYARMYLSGQYLPAGIIMAVSCLTDCLDGMIARRYNQITNLGKLLDPLADKITQLTVLLCLCLKLPALHPVLALLLVKEIFQLVTAIHYFRKGQALDGALAEGKICTAVLFGSLLALVIFPNAPYAVVEALAMMNGFLLVVSFLSYARAYFGKETKLQDL